MDVGQVKICGQILSNGSMECPNLKLGVDYKIKLNVIVSGMAWVVDLIIAFV